MDIQFYNTLTNQKERFEPASPPDVYMYNCGPTVYDYAHIGNFRAFVFADVIRRFLELTGHTVHQVMNITDVGHMTDDQDADGRGRDKMEEAIIRIKAAIAGGRISADEFDDPSDPFQIARFYTDAFVDDARKLGIKVAFDYDRDPAKTRMPHATDHVRDDMVPMIQELIDSQHAYVAADGAVYYDVQSFPDYGRLSGNTLDKLRGGAGGRVSDEHQAVKRHPADFLLWKPDASHLMKWPSPWGEGYPGWHIECSAMARALLGRDVIDIHTGGEDNIFPHHECEIAQSRGATGQTHFARFWMHTRFLLVEGEKMSKSKGNFYTVRDVLEGRVTGRPVDPAVLRYELLKTHYRSNANFTKQGLHDAANVVQRLRRKRDEWSASAKGHSASIDSSHPIVAGFISALADDLNVSQSLAVLFEWLAGNQSKADVSLAILQQVDTVLGVLPKHIVGTGNFVAPAATLAGEAEVQAKQIDEARASKDFETADRIRQELIDAGYDVQTTKDGTIVRKKLA